MKFEKSRLEPVRVDIGGVEYPAQIKIGGMLEIEEILGESFFSAYDRFAINKFSANDVKLFLYAALKGGGVEVSLDDLDDVDFTIDVIKSIDDVIARSIKISDSLAEPVEDIEGSDKKKQSA